MLCTEKRLQQFETFGALFGFEMPVIQRLYELAERTADVTRMWFGLHSYSRRRGYLRRYYNLAETEMRFMESLIISKGYFS